MQTIERKDVALEYTWKLEDIFETDENWEQTFNIAQKEIESISKYQGTLGENAINLKKGLDVQAELSLKVEKLYVYASMKRDQDNANALYQGMADKGMTLAVNQSSACSFFVPEILEIDDEKLCEWINLPDMKTYYHSLKDLIRNKKYILSHKEERIMAMAGEMNAVPQNIYRMIDNADIRFPIVKTDQGEQEITHGNLIHFMQNEDRSLRKEAFGKFYSSYDQFKNTYAAALSGSIKGDIFNSRTRGYASSLEASLHDDNVPVSVYDSLIHAVHEKLPAVHRYMNLRKKALKLDKVHMYDLYAPLSNAEFNIKYEEAQELICEGLKVLGSDYQQKLKEAFSNRWIDVHENKGKSSGAYCWGCYGTHPYVLLNYQPNLDSIFTIAHELGHAMHSYYSDQKQDYNNAQYKIILAEVASTINETILIQYLLEKETDRDKRLRLLNYYLEQFRTTVYRQVMFAEFEKITHEYSENGESLTSEYLSKTYLDLNKLYHGEEVHLDSGIEVEWARISHFYSSFYVYKYATGFSAAVTLSRAIMQEGDSALNRYHEFLSSGGSDYPLDLLKKAGVDLTKPEPVKQALIDFESNLDKLEELL